jgi:hypothetical protein
MSTVGQLKNAMSWVIGTKILGWTRFEKCDPRPILDGNLDAGV